MKKLIPLTAWLCAMAFIVSARPALATGTNLVSYVSNGGTDSPNTCANPTTDACATFAYALTQTASGGEIDCVNAGPAQAYNGNFTIAQSVTIDCAGSVGLTPGRITINASGIVVRLRNLTFNSFGAGFFGIDGENMAALYVENCVITNYNNALGWNSGAYIGINFTPSGSAQLFVTDSVISNNGLSGESGGIYISGGSNVTIDRSQINGNYFGIIANGNARVTVSNSVVSGNTEDGIAAISSWVFVDQSRVSGNAYGLAAHGSGAEVLVRNTSVFSNTTGLTTSASGTIYSYGTNSVNGNTTNGAFTGTVALK